MAYTQQPRWPFERLTARSNLQGPPEKREYFRIDAVLPVSYCAEGDTAPPPSQPVRVNLSVGGIGLYTEQPLQVGDVLLLSLVLPAGSIQTKAKVVRALPNAVPAAAPRPALACSGLQFIGMAEGDREMLIRYIFSFQVEQRRSRYV